MIRFARLFFLIPAFFIVTPAVAQPLAIPAAISRAPIRYVALDRMIRGFAAQSLRQQHAARNEKRPTVLAQR